MTGKPQVFSFENKEHILFLNYLFFIHKDKFFNDFIKSSKELLKWLFYSQQNGCPLFIYYVDEKPYGVIYADIDYCKIATIHASCIHNKNFFLNLRILKSFLSYLFDDLGVLKIKSELLVYDTMAELLLRCAGFKKEGILKDEILINGNLNNMLLLALTKNNYKNNRLNLIKSDIIKIGKRIKNEQTHKTDNHT